MVRGVGTFGGGYPLRVNPRALTIARRTDRGCTVVTPQGHLDLRGYPCLRDTLLKCAADEPTALVVELGELVVDRISMLSVFPTVRIRTSAWPAVPMLLAGARPPLEGMLEASAVPRFLAYHRTTASALEAVGRQPVRHCSEINLPGELISAAAARRWTKGALALLDPRDRDLAVLVVSELVENVLRHTGSGCRLQLRIHEAGLAVAVTDSDPRPPLFSDREVGVPRFGLALVDLFSRAWGYTPRWDGGKVVWAVLPVQGGPTGPPAPSWTDGIE